MYKAMGHASVRPRNRTGHYVRASACRGWAMRTGGFVMPYEVEVNQYLGLAVCTLWGLVWVEERQVALDEVLAEMEEGRPYRILVDMIGASCANDSLDDQRCLRATPRHRTQAARAAASRICIRTARASTWRSNVWPKRAISGSAASPRRPKRSTGCSRRRRASSPRRAIEAQAEPDAMTLLAGLRTGRWVA